MGLEEAEGERKVRSAYKNPLTNASLEQGFNTHIKKKKKKSRNFKQIFILSFDALRERKARSALTILMVVVGSSLMVALNGMSAGQSNFLNKQLNTLAPNILFISSGQLNFRGGGGGGPPSAPTIVINSQVVDRIRSLPFVQQVVPSYQGQLQLDAQGNILNTATLAMNPQKIYLINPSLQLVDGSTIRPNDPSSILIGDSIANPPGKTTPFATVGQTIKGTFSFVDPANGKQKQESKSFVVSGIIQPSGNNQIDRAVIIKEATGNSLFHKSGKYDQMVVSAQSGDYVDTVKQEITGLYGNNIGVITPKAILMARQQFQSGNSSFILGIAFIALLVGAVGIITTLYTSVNERTQEIGTMKAIGAKKRFILTLFLTEALLIGIFGSTLGLLVGVNGAYVLTSSFAPRTPGTGPSGGHISPVFVANDISTVWLLSVILSLGAGLFPAWKAARLSPIAALRR